MRRFPNLARTLPAGLLATLLALAGCEQEPAPAPRSAASGRPPVRVETTPVTPVSYQPRLLRNCHFRARTRIRVRNPEAGEILAVPVEVGDRVRRGELLVRLDDRRLRAELAKARARLRQAELDLRRLERLRDPGLASEDERERARTEQALARAEVELLELRLDDMRLRAPIDGQVAERRVEAGEHMPAGTHLLTLIDPRHLVVAGDVPVSRLPGEGMPAFEIRAEAPAAAWHPATLLHLGPAADPATGLAPFELRPERLPEGAFDGAPCRVRLLLPERRGLLVPLDALQRDASGEYLFVVDGDRARRREVRSGSTLGDRIEILAGLRAGERIVTRGFLGLRDGARVALDSDS